MARLKQLGLVGVALAALIACGNPAGATSTAAQPPAQSTVKPPAKAEPVTPDSDESAAAAALDAYRKRINEYTAFQKRGESMIGRQEETKDPQKIADRELALGKALIASRPNAKQGEFFIKEVQPILAKMIRDDFAKRSLADRKALIVELPKGLRVGVNQIYPTQLPLATFPPNLLRVLPELPAALEYRIVGRHLILRDVKGNVIVDMMPDVFPIPQ